MLPDKYRICQGKVEGIWQVLGGVGVSGVKQFQSWFLVCWQGREGGDDIGKTAPDAREDGPSDAHMPISLV